MLLQAIYPQRLRLSADSLLCYRHGLHVRFKAIKFMLFTGRTAGTHLNTQELISHWSSQSAEELAAKASEHLPIWVSLGLVVLIAYYLARLAWLVYPGADEVLWIPPQASPSQSVQSVGKPVTNYDAITNAHLFGNATEVDAPIVENTEDAPDTRLNLSLRATIAANNEQIAHAIIADGAGKEKVYFFGDSVPGGAKLHRVDLDRVILNRGGVMEALRLPKKYADAGARAPSAANNRRAPATSNAAPPNIQQLISQNAASFAEIVRPQPFMPNGKLKGYRVFPGRNRQQFIALGLRPGDLVTEINGVALTDPAQGMQVFNSLGTSSQVSVTVERNGRSEVLALDTSQILSAGDGPR
jgi:general secretion pathway protein C